MRIELDLDVYAASADMKKVQKLQVEQLDQDLNGRVVEMKNVKIAGNAALAKLVAGGQNVFDAFEKYLFRPDGALYVVAKEIITLTMFERLSLYEARFVNINSNSDLLVERVVVFYMKVIPFTGDKASEVIRRLENKDA